MDAVRAMDGPGGSELRDADRSGEVLILTRREGEQVLIGDQIVVSVDRIGVERVTLGITTPRGMVRGEQVEVGDQILVSVDRIGAKKVTLGITAPRGVHIDRAEVRAKVALEGRRREP